MGLKTEISKLHYDKNAKGFLFNSLKFCSCFYAFGSRLKNYLYDNQILKPKKVSAYVISVGNLTTGGVGKTPVVAQIAKYLIEKGEKVAIVSRGYGGKLSGVNIISDGEKIFFHADKAGDEPRWLAENTSAIVITSKNRYKGAKFAIDKFGATKIILDDGFQHRKLHRDLNIVLVDSEMGFGNENLLPAGPMREGFEAFDRIDKLVIVSKNTNHERAEKYAKIIGKKLKKEAFVCYNEPDYAYNIFNIDADIHSKPGLECESRVGLLTHRQEAGSALNECRHHEKLSKGEKILAFSAIGQPQQFYKFLKDYDVVKTVDFDDHHNYSQKDIEKLQQICLDLDIKTLVTTEKDGGKCKSLSFYLKVYALKLKTNLDVEKLLIY